ncbi:hypothetical protein [Microbacterium paraoxydans]|uniref:hypothetical protein n=1 Tax=Microbacterium paraoxydans TaxID=199592 RepID=UPI00046852DB|nr:hypothetical protein [Microbacterium paraoxydans]
MSIDLHTRAAEFAQQVQDTIAGVLPGEFQIVSISHGGRYVVRPVGDNPSKQHIPLFVDGHRLATLGVQIYLGLDSSGQFLKAWQSKIAVHSTLDRTPLVRQEFDAAMSESAPLAHWHVHADRGALSHLLGRAHAVRGDVVKKPHDMSSLHFPVGGERFRPCIEDVLEFLVREFGIDRQDGWESAVRDGRERWRRMQFRSTVRDLPDEAADVLRKHGWSVTPPEEARTEGLGVLQRW